MTGSVRRATVVLAALAGALMALGLGVATAGPAAGVQPMGGQAVAAGAWDSADLPSAVTAVQSVADREVTRAVVAVRTDVQGLRGSTAATLQVLVTALLLLCIASWRRPAPRTESVPQRGGAPRSPPGAIRS
ncbi:MAG TPA: hypothetical protein VIM19_13830 [Actinomycetes bacterium]